MAKSRGIWRSQDMFPAEAARVLPVSATSSAIDASRPFGLRYLVDAHPSTSCDLDPATVRFDDTLQMLVMSGETDGQPAFKHTSGQTSTTTSVQDRKAPDSDTDYEQDK